MGPASTIGAETCLLSRSTKKCFTPTLGVNTKNMLDRVFIHQINALSSCCYLLEFYCRKETWGYAKVIQKEKKKKLRKKKIDKCLRYLKQWVLRYPSKKER
jgi:hypothetical protein